MSKQIVFSDPFYMEINQASLEVLMRAHKLDAKALAEILSRSQGYAEELMRGEHKPSSDLAQEVQKSTGIRPLLTPNGGRTNFLIQLTAQSLGMVRKGRGLSSVALAKLAEISPDHLRRLQRGQKKPSPDLAGVLSNILHCQFFLI